jgi:hypothetical protein
MIIDTPAGMAMHRVISREDWARVRALRFEALTRAGDIDAGRDRGYTDGHDLALNTSTFLLARNGRAIGSCRASVSAPNRRGALPAMEPFTLQLQSAIGLEATVVEASLVVVDPATSIDRRVVVLHLLKSAMLECATRNADWLVTAVRENDIGFHRRMLDMEILSGAEACPGMLQPRVLMGLPYREKAAIVFKRTPVLGVSPADESEYAATGSVRFPQRAMSQAA